MKHAKLIPAYTPTCVEGVTFLWFFDPGTGIGFAWTGESKDPIEVSHGGFGSPVTNIYPLPDRWSSSTPTAFQIRCLSLLQQISDGWEPMAVKGAA